MSVQPLVRDSSVHYDNQPSLFELFLDTNLNYSCGYYLTGNEDLDVAQRIKMDRIAEELSMRPGDHILDLGCGWSGPAVYFAKEKGCRVTGITLSPVQQAYGVQRAQQHDVKDQVQIEVRSVLDLPYANNSVDHILFLESIIHMPQKAEIFRRCYELLKPGGMIFIQESHYDRAGMRQKYLSDRGAQEVNKAFGFTNNMVTGGEMLSLLEDANLLPIQLENVSNHYVITLSQWLDRIDAASDRMRSISTSAYWMLRRYLMIALGTYRSGGTVCYRITASKRKES